jgi:hypothetical protein
MEPENLSEAEERVAEEVKLDVTCECDEPNDEDDDSDEVEADMSNIEPGFNPDEY